MAPPTSTDTDVVNALSKLIRDLRETDDLFVCLRRVAETAQDVLPCEGASLRLLDEDKEQFVAVGRAGERVHASPYAKLKVSEGVPGWVAWNGESVLINDSHTDDRFVSRIDQVRDIRSILCVPLVEHDRVIGVLGATHTETDRFTSHHLDILELIAHCSLSSVAHLRSSHLGQTDLLTGILRRRYWDQRFKGEVLRCQLHSKECTLAVLDLDGFRKINDTYERHTGDKVLQEVASVLTAELRLADMAGRHGPDSFAILMPETTRTGAKALMTRLRRSLSSLKIKIPPDRSLDGPITASIGIAELVEGDSANLLMHKAEGALIRARIGGGDRIETS